MAPSCKYTGPWLDSSGYAQANRNFIAALYIAGVKITTELVNQMQIPSDRDRYGWTGNLCKALEDKDMDYKIKFIHLTPDCYPRYMESGKYHIGHLFWETDKIPKEWIDPCNKMNEIWTASQLQAEMIKKSGVKTPIFWFPQPIDTTPANNKKESYLIPNSFSGFLFYSIFHWIERKNPRALVVNFWKAFEDKDDVALIIKTHGVNYSDEEFDKIRSDIKQWKMETPLRKYPRIYLVKKLMNTDQMFRLHLTGDCYVNTSRGEGWCLPAVEAAMMGKPVIGINKTGFADYFNSDLFFPCDTSVDSVMEVPSIKFYKSDQKWLEIKSEDLVAQMLKVYNDQKAAEKVGQNAQKFVLDNFNYWKVGEAMRQRLEEIEREI